MPHPVQVYDFQAFACTNCGRCCRPWEVALEGAQAEAIRQSHAYQSRVKKGYQPLLVVRPGVGELGDRGDDHCTFLDNQNLCELHAELGGGSKPLGCQLFPYQVVQTPEGLHVYLSFACPPVVAGLDADVESNRQQLDAALGIHSEPLPDSPESPFLVKLWQGAAIPWESYLRLESSLLASYRPAQPLDSVLGMVLDLFEICSGPFSPACDPWPDLKGGGHDLSFAREILSKLLGFLVAIFERCEDGQRGLAVARAVEQGLSISSGPLEMILPPLNLEPPSADWVQTTYHRYFRNAFQGKAVLRSTVASKLLEVAAALALTSYYAEAYRQARGLEALDLETLTDAFALVESELATHNPAAAGDFTPWEETFRRLSDFGIN